MKKELQPKVKLLSVVEASQVVDGFSAFHVRKLCQTGELPSIMTGNKYLVEEKCLINYVENLFQQKPEEQPIPETLTGVESLVCPYCESVHDEIECDLWELQEQGEYVCQECGQTMNYSKSYTASYHSEPIEKRTGGNKCKMKLPKKQ